MCPPNSCDDYVDVDTLSGKASKKRESPAASVLDLSGEGHFIPGDEHGEITNGHPVMEQQREGENDPDLEVPKRNRKKFRVPPAPPGGFFFRAVTRRAVQEGELLSDSDDDVDISWLKRQHAEDINSYADLTEAEKAFITRWDNHMSEERIQSIQHLSNAMIRFATFNRSWLQGREALVEFFKLSTKLTMSHDLPHSVVQECMGIVQAFEQESKRAEELRSKAGRELVDLTGVPDDAPGTTYRRYESMSAQSEPMDLEHD
ncbi:MAG: hypothetical protein M1826_003968 [Phylliscum demangeonii]|nr:MAG: hypothetical protein M1826_003968 [Phylliscum demangeonii]